MTHIALDVVIVRRTSNSMWFLGTDIELDVVFSDGYQTQGSISDGYRSRCELLSDEGRTRCGD